MSSQSKKTNYMLRESENALVDDHSHVVLNYSDFFPSSMEQEFIPDPVVASSPSRGKSNQTNSERSSEVESDARLQAKSQAKSRAKSIIKSDGLHKNGKENLQDLRSVANTNYYDDICISSADLVSSSDEYQVSPQKKTNAHEGSCISSKPMLINHFALKSATPDVFVDSEPVVTSPYFQKSSQKSLKKSSLPKNDVKIASPLKPAAVSQNSRVSTLSASQAVSWSSSPDYHKNETLTSITKRNQSELSPSKPAVDENKKKPRSAASYLQPGRNGQTHFLQLKDAQYVKESIAKDQPSNDADVSKVLSKDMSKDSSYFKEKDGALAPVFLSAEQKKILEMVLQGHSVFFTGAAGTGKSVLLRRIIMDLVKQHGSRRVGITASTGLAAYNIGGATLHSFTGIGLGKEDVESLYKKIRRHRTKLSRWKSLKTLIIDEISMVDGDLFDKLEELARKIRRNQRPFGGIQLVITGDFFQLPPVSKNDDMKFAFESESWRYSIPNTLLLEQVFRQKDNRFSNMLNEMRRGIMSRETVATFQQLTREIPIPEGITATEIFPRRYEVDRANSLQLNSLSSQSVNFVSVDHYQSKEVESMGYLDNLMAMPVIKLKVGAQVMMIKNIDETLVNGSLGKVLGFMSESAYRYVKKAPKNVLDRLLAAEPESSVTDEIIQKTPEAYVDSQQQPEEEDSEDDDYSVFAIPENWESLEENGSNVKWRRKIDRLKQLYDNSRDKGEVWPLVRFVQTNGTTRDVLCHPETWKFEDPVDGTLYASRTQIPLILAWAISIHKAQGQTLPYLKVNLSKVFEKGQAYVAVSRAVSLDGLQVTGFDPHRVMVHPKVLRFYDELYNVFHLVEKNKSLETRNAESETEKQEEQEQDNQIGVDEKELPNVGIDDSGPVDGLYSNTLFADLSGKKPATPLESDVPPINKGPKQVSGLRRSKRNTPRLNYHDPAFADLELDPDYRGDQHAFM